MQLISSTKLLLLSKKAAEFSETAVVMVFVVVAAIGVLKALGVNISDAIGQAASAI